MWERLDDIERRYEELSALMARPEIASDFVRYQALAKEQSALAATVELYREYKNAGRELEQARVLVEESDDRDMRELGQEEVARLAPQVERLTQQLKLAVMPKDPRDERNVFPKKGNPPRVAADGFQIAGV